VGNVRTLSKHLDVRQQEPDMAAERAAYCEWALIQADAMDPRRR
jgi:hypothetical protein